MEKMTIEITGFFYQLKNINDNDAKQSLIAKAIEAKKATIVASVSTQYPKALGVFIDVDGKLTQIGWVGEKANVSGTVTRETVSNWLESKKANSCEIKITKNNFSFNGGNAFAEILISTAKKENPLSSTVAGSGSPSAEEIYYVIGTGTKTKLNEARYEPRDMLLKGSTVPCIIQAKGTEPVVFLYKDDKLARCCQLALDGAPDTENAIKRLNLAGISQQFLTNASELSEILDKMDVTSEIIGMSTIGDYCIKLTCVEKATAKAAAVDKTGVSDFLKSVSEKNLKGLSARVNYLLSLTLPGKYVEKYMNMWKQKDAAGVQFSDFTPLYEDTETMGSTVMSLICQEAWDTGNIRLVGPKGCGKNMAVLTFASLWGGSFQDNSINAETCYDVLVGAQAAYTDVNGNMNTGFRPSIVVDKVQQYGVVNLDEINLAQPGSLMAFQPLLDKRGYIEIPELGTKTRDDFCVITATMNEGKGYAGTRLQNEAFEDRFATIYVQGKDSITEIIRKDYPELDNKALKALNLFWVSVKKTGKDVSIRKMVRAASAISNGNTLKDALMTRVVETASLKDRDVLEKIVDKVCF